MIACPVTIPPAQRPCDQAFACYAADAAGRLRAPLRADDPLFRLACRIAVNRTVAACTSPPTAPREAVLGMQLAHYMLARADPAATAHGAQFDGRLYHDGGAVRDFHYGILAEMLDDADPATRLRGPALTRARMPL